MMHLRYTSFSLVQCWLIFLLDRATVHGAHATVTMVQGTTPIDTPVSYSCEFVNRWTAETHPEDYPNSAHWSPMVIASHNEKYSMWADKTPATKGVKSVAETGSVGAIKKELTDAGDNIGSSAVGGVFFPNKNKHTISITDSLMMDENHILISSITMIAPSPDWFSGLTDFSPVKDGMWLTGFTVDTYPWDAGTDSGTTYASTNTATKPQGDIFELVPEKLPNSVFLSKDGTVEPVAQWVCTLNDVECTEKKKDKFFLKIKDGLIITKPCKWLSKGKKKRKKRACKKEDRNEGFGPAKEVCPVTCDSCTR